MMDCISQDEVVAKMSNLTMNSKPTPTPKKNNTADINNLNQFHNPELDEELRNFNVDDVIRKYRGGLA